MVKEDDKVLIQFIYKDNTKKSLLIPPDRAKELEILAITGVPRRITKAIIRIGKKLLDRKGEVNNNDVLSPSRSGDLYNALNFLIKEKIIEKNKERKKIKVINFDKLNSLLSELKDLVREK
ncbi:MAG: hypothetical protein HWN67_01660 [Candidatus Helarchaeota archaeon]|nr:hypothetical protein [Candidatus Helarchaeota archaeon]